jgi:hypothetical protein
VSDVPAPLTPVDCDLRDFQYMELDVRRLRDSEFAAGVTGEAFRAGVLLWCAAWHQVPAASLPDNDTELANLAGYGRVVKEWRKVREQALTGFVKCSDGRLYHAVIAEKAVSAYAAKERHAYGKFLERMRKENARREKEKKPTFGIPTVEQWKTGAYPHGIPPIDPVLPDGNHKEVAANSTQIPPENALKGNGEGTERERELISVPDGTGGFTAKPAAEVTKAELWSVGKSLLFEQGMPKPQCGTFVGKLCSDYGDDIVIDAVRATCVKRPADAAEFLKACCMHAAGQRSKTPRRASTHTGFEHKDYREGVGADGSLI